MSNELISKVSAMLKEETWTRATISNYTKSNLSELNEIIDEAKKEGCTADIKELSDDHLSHNKDSIIALYISGILNAKDGAIDNSCLVNLVDIFLKAHKEPVVEYLCDNVLEQDENNKFALRTLIALYEAADEAKVWELREKLVKLDYEDAENAKKLAEHFEAQGDAKNSVSFYKKALLRYVTAKNLSAIKELWTKLVSLIPEEIDFFLLVQRKIAKSISDDKSALLMQELYNWYKDNQKWDIAIDILKLILSIDQKDPWARREITDCFRNKYSDHSQLDDYITSSNLEQSFRNVFDAISDFEKHIAFDAKNYVFHKSWGVGIIRKVEQDTLYIYFGKDSNGEPVKKKMSLKMAIEALKPLAKDHIWVLKATKSKQELVEMVKKDKEGTLKIIIKSFDNRCDFKRIKAELVPAILGAGEWTSWNTQAKKILEENSEFGVDPNDINQYMVRDHKISKEEKIANEFKAQKVFFSRVDIIMKYLEDEDTDKESDLFAEMYNYFISHIKTITNVTKEILSAYLVVQYVSKVLPAHAYTCKYTFEQIYGDIDDPRKMYGELKDTKNTHLKDDFLTNIKMLPNWADEYIRLFPTVLEGKMLDYLSEKGNNDKLKKLVQTAFNDIKDFRNAILYFFENCQDKDWFKESGITYEKQLIALLNVIELTFREINSHVNTTENKKINKWATELLFDPNSLILEKFMFENGIEMISKMYTLADDIPDLNSKIKASLRSHILEQYPDFKFRTTEEKSAAPKGMMVTAKMLEEKKARVEQIQKVEIPANAAEISEAREKGDLKENAEYQAAKEHQRKLNHDLTRLQAEIDRAVVFDPTTATTAFVSFATKVTLLNKTENKEEVYTILGPWESDTEKGIISYMSPVGNELMNHKVGDELDFVVNEHNYKYKVLSIAIANV